jgi:methionyl-tRNA formyltransferase
MNVALMGSVSSSHTVLRAFVDAKVDVTAVVGVPPEAAAKISDYHDLGPLARAAGLDYLGFRKVSEPAVEAFLEARAPDLLWVIGLSQLVPDRLINLARGGGIGFHPTMLPEGRGRAPVAWTILKQARAAVSLFYLTEEADAGDLIFQREVRVEPEDYSEDLIARTNEVLYDAVLELAPALKAGRLPRQPQDHTKATHYPKRTPADGRIDWHQPTDDIYRLIRAAGRPYPGAFSMLEGRQLIIWRAKPVVTMSDTNTAPKVGTTQDAETVSNSATAPDRAVPLDAEAAHAHPGTVVRLSERSEPLVRTGDGLLRLTEYVWAAAEGQDADQPEPSLGPGVVLG